MLTVLTVLTVAALAVTAVGAAPGAPEQAATPASTPAAPGVAGLLVIVDPETGQVVDDPTPEQLAAAAARLLPFSAPSLKRSDAGLEPFALATGGRGVFLEGRFQSATVVRLGADGTFILECVDSPEAAARFLAQPPPPVQWEEK